MKPSLQFKQMMNLIVCLIILKGFLLSVYVEASFLQALMVLEGNEVDIFSKAIDRIPLFLLKTKIKQNPGCLSKE